MRIRPVRTADYDAVRQVLQLAFGQDGEANLVESLRTAGCVALELVAELESQLVGQILFSDLAIETDGGVVRSLALAPLAVHPAFQRRGIGSELVRQALQQSREAGRTSVVVLGHPDFYPRFGFSARLAEPLECPFYTGPALMAVELVNGALADVRGRLVYPPPFSHI